MIHPVFPQAILYADSVIGSNSKETEHFNYKVTGLDLTRL